LTGFVVAPNKAIVGLNAFRHESGIHQDGVLKERKTYEIIKPQDVGFTGIGIVLGKHSGRHAFVERFKNLGIELSARQLDGAFKEFKLLADKKKTIYDDDLLSIVEDQIKIVPQVWRLISFQVNCGTDIAPQAKIELKSKGKIRRGCSTGDGPVDACYKAIEKVIGIKTRLLDYHIGAVTSGEDALGEVSVRIESRGRAVVGRSASTDIIEASVKAYLEAINKIKADITYATR
jgi:2-isopropylmalate synthase